MKYGQWKGRTVYHLLYKTRRQISIVPKIHYQPSISLKRNDYATSLLLLYRNRIIALFSMALVENLVIRL